MLLLLRCCGCSLHVLSICWIQRWALTFAWWLDDLMWCARCSQHVLIICWIGCQVLLLTLVCWSFVAMCWLCDVMCLRFALMCWLFASVCRRLVMFFAVMYWLADCWFYTVTWNHLAIFCSAFDGCVTMFMRPPSDWCIGAALPTKTVLCKYQFRSQFWTHSQLT